MTILNCGIGTGHWSASITRSMSGCANETAAKRARRRRSSTARAPREHKKGGFARSFRLRRGQKVKGRKRHILVDTLGLLLSVVVHPANIQDRDGAYEVLRQARRLFPFIERIFADGGYRGEKMALVVARTGSWKLEIVKRSDVANGFEVLPKRWIVERTFAWISRCRRLTRDFERYARTTIAFIRLVMIRIMLRRLVVNPSS